MRPIPLYFPAMSLAAAALAACAPTAFGFGALDPAGWWRGLCGGPTPPVWPLIAAAGDMAGMTALLGPGICVFFAGVLAWLCFAGPTDVQGRAAALAALPALAASPLCRLGFDLPMRLALLALWAASLACLGLAARGRSTSMRRLLFLSAGFLTSASAVFEPMGLSLVVLGPVAAGLAQAAPGEARREAPDPFARALPLVCLGSLGLVWLTLPGAVRADALAGHVSAQLAVTVLFFGITALAALAAPRAVAGRGLSAWHAAGASLLLPFVNFRQTRLTPLEDSLAGVPAWSWVWMAACGALALAALALRLRSPALAGARSRLTLAAACAIIPLGAALVAQPRLDVLGGLLAAFVLALAGLDAQSAPTALAGTGQNREPDPEPGGKRAAPPGPSPCLGFLLLVPLALAAPPFGPAAGHLLRQQALAPWARTEAEAPSPAQLALAARAPDILSACAELLPRTRIRAADVGLLAPGALLGASAGPRRIIRVSAPAGPLLSLTPRDLSVTGFVGFAVHYEYLGMPFYKPVPGGKPGFVTLLPRADVWSWLFLREDQAAAHGELLRDASGPGPIVEVLEAGQSRRYQGRLIERLTLVPADVLRDGAFFGLALDRFDLGP